MHIDRDKSEETTFRINPIPYCQLVSLGFGSFSIGFAVLGIIVQIWGQRFPDWNSLILATLIPWLVCACFCILIWIDSQLKFYIHPYYLYCRDGIGKLQIIAWQDIQKVELVTYNGFPYLLIYGNHLKRVMHMPLWLKDLERLTKTSILYGGYQHPVARGLQFTESYLQSNNPLLFWLYLLQCTDNPQQPMTWYNKTLLEQ